MTPNTVAPILQLFCSSEKRYSNQLIHYIASKSVIMTGSGIPSFTAKCKCLTQHKATTPTTHRRLIYSLSIQHPQKSRSLVITFHRLQLFLSPSNLRFRSSPHIWTAPLHHSGEYDLQPSAESLQILQSPALWLNRFPHIGSSYQILMKGHEVLQGQQHSKVQASLGGVTANGVG